MKGKDDPSSSRPRAHAEARRRLQRPDNEVPASVELEAVLGETEGLAVFVCGLSVYRDGVGLTLEVRASPGHADSRTDESDFLGGAVVRGDLLLGVEFADGRRCSNLPGRRRAPRPDEPVLWSDGGGGGSRSAAVSWFLSPLPPPGELRIICAWSSRGIEECITTLPAEPILAAASRARELWPSEPEPRSHRPASRPEGPTTDWFAENAPPTA